MGKLRRKLDMYASAVSDAAFAAFGDYVLEGLDEACLDETASDRLMLGQICGIEFAHAAPGQYHYLGSFSLPGFAPGHYNSVLISRRGGGIEQRADIDLTRHCMAVNEAGSFSGSIAPKAHMAAHRLGHRAGHMMGRGDAPFPRCILTGGHHASIEAVASGAADVAGIDRLSFNLGLYACPDSWRQVMIFDETSPAPGLPFICDGGVEAGVVSLLRDRLAHAPEQDFWPELSRLLGVNGMAMIGAEEFAAMRDV